MTSEHGDGPEFFAPRQPAQPQVEPDEHRPVETPRNGSSAHPEVGANAFDSGETLYMPVQPWAAPPADREPAFVAIEAAAAPAEVEPIPAAAPPPAPKRHWARTIASGIIGIPAFLLLGVLRRGRKQSLAREVIETLVLAAVIFLGVRAVVQNFKVEGSSMYSSFLDGEYMLVNKAVYARFDVGLVHRVLPFVDPGKNPKHYIFHGPQRGDVIVFVPPPASGATSKDFIKRVIGVPGDTISFRDNHVFVNGRQVIEPYITARTDCQGQYCNVSLQRDQFFVMGDNRGNSSDSRFWGPVSADKIVGKALLSYWCGGSQCKGRTDHIGLAPNHSPSLAPAAAKP